MELFQMGEEASRAKMQGALDDLRQDGQDVIDSMLRQQHEVLLSFDRRLGALNARRARAARIAAPGITVRFLVSDLNDIEQGQSSAALRADAGVATLHERGSHADVVIRQKKFSSSGGTVEQVGTLFRVHTDDGSRPKGTFDIELAAPSVLTMIVFDIAAVPSGSEVTVAASADGLEYKTATTVSLNGYRVTAWLPEVEAKYLRISVLPSHADGLGGSSYTFGLTAINALAVDFHLRSELVSRPILFNPRGRQLRLAAADEPGLAYYLSLVEPGHEDQFLEARPGDVLTLPSVFEVETTDVVLNDVAKTTLTADAVIDPLNPLANPTVLNLLDASRFNASGSVFLNGMTLLYTGKAGNSLTGVSGWPTNATTSMVGDEIHCVRPEEDGRLLVTLPADYYPSSLEVLDQTTNKRLPLVFGYDLLNAATDTLAGNYVAVNGTQLNLLHYQKALEVGASYTVRYSHGPSPMQAKLRVVLTTSDPGSSPLYRGATLEEI